MGNALDALFNSEEPNKERSAERKAEVKAERKAIKTTTAKADPPKNGKRPAPDKKACSVCKEEHWPFHMKDGICKECQEAMRPEPVKTKSEPKPPKAKPKTKTPKAEPKPDKSEGRKRGLDSDAWHEKEATYNQTSFLKKSTGLKTWDLEKNLTRIEASTMISAIKEGNGGADKVYGILVKTFGCVKYVRPGSKAKPATAPAKDDEVAILREQIRTLSEALTAMEAVKEAS